jgi:hypothetical protein
MTFKVRATIAVVCGLTSLAPAMAHADYVYQYVGSTFNYGLDGFGTTYTPPSENLTATLVVASALAPSTTYSFVDGGSNFIDLSLNFMNCDAASFSCLVGATISTNLSGAISSWSISAENHPPISLNGSNKPNTYNVPNESIGGPPGYGSVPLYGAILSSNGLAGPDYVEGSTTPGTWSASPVPLPAGGWLLLSGMGGLGLLIGRRPRVPNPARRRPRDAALDTYSAR